MITEIGSTILFAGLGAYAYLKTNGPATNDAEKIQRIFRNAGWTGKDNGETKEIRLKTKRPTNAGIEYVFQVPLGFNRKKVEENIGILKDGLNTKDIVPEIRFKELKKWDVTKPIKHNIKRLTKDTVKAEKDVAIEFDGMLKIKVYDEPIPDRIDWDIDMLKRGTWSTLIGFDRSGPVYHDFDKRKHLIVAGSTGFGKSVLEKMIITCLVVSRPDDAEFTLIDLKEGASFDRFKNLKQVKRYARDVQSTKEKLKEVQKDMNRDYRKIVEAGFEDISEAKIKKRHFIVIDEGADMADDNDAMDTLTDIVRKGRGAGYYVIFSTQYPTAKAIPSQVKRNIPARVCFVLDSGTASNVVLDGPGAEDLPEIPGRCIYKQVKRTVVQSPYMSNKQIKELTREFEIWKGDHDRESKNDSTGTPDRKHSIEFKKA